MLSVSSLPAVETQIKGGSMELLQNGESVYFKDGVELIRAGDRLTAREMKTTSSRDKISAWGNVKIYRKVKDGEIIEGFGDEGFYDTKKGTGYLIGKTNQ